MDVPLIRNSSLGDRITFRECAVYVTEKNGHYNKKLYILLALYWIIASFFIAFQFYLYRRPLFEDCPSEHDSECIARVCEQCQTNLRTCRVVQVHTFTYIYSFYCQYQWVRVMYKIFPETLSFFGFIIYGFLSDSKGRKVAIKISWRLFTLGVVIYSCTQTLFLRSLGYIVACIHCYPCLVCQFVLLFQQTNENNRIKASLLILSTLFVGPLVLSIVAESILQSVLNIRGSLLFFCALPAFILSFFIGQLKQSPLYIYRENKVLSFNILNQIAKENKIKPILIDLSKSCWKQHKSVPILKQFWKHSEYKRKTILGFFYFFAIFYCIRSAQISLDSFTDSYYRNLIMNLATSSANIVLCIVINRIQSRKCRYLFIAIAILYPVLIITFSLDISDSTFQIITYLFTTALRFCSDFCYGILLIWAIEVFPTDYRNKMSSLVMSGTSLGCMLAYILKKNLIILWSLGFFFVILLILFQNLMEFHKHGVMVDTLKGQLYDDHDEFQKFQKFH